jgi:hypothetical protein
MFNLAFWTTLRGFGQSHVIDDIFAKGDVTLSQLLNEEEVVSGVKTSNSKLIEFLNSEEILLEMLDYIIIEPTEEEGTQRCNKFPFIAAEILTAENPQIMDQFFNSQLLLPKLFSFLD